MRHPQNSFTHLLEPSFHLVPRHRHVPNIFLSDQQPGERVSACQVMDFRSILITYYGIGGSMNQRHWDLSRVHQMLRGEGIHGCLLTVMREPSFEPLLVKLISGNSAPGMSPEVEPWGNKREPQLPEAISAQTAAPEMHRSFLP